MLTIPLRISASSRSVILFSFGTARPRSNLAIVSSRLSRRSTTSCSRMVATNVFVLLPMRKRSSFRMRSGGESRANPKPLTNSPLPGTQSRRPRPVPAASRRTFRAPS